jgi:signal peptidase II
MRKVKGCWRNLHWLWLALIVIILDQWTKNLALVKLMPYEPQAIFPFFNLTLAFNAGAAFSFLHEESGWQRWLFALIAMVASIGLTFWLYKLSKGQKCLSLALALIIGGALGNLWDRFAYGHVVDFLDFYVKNWHWPAFNVADTAICIGAGLLLIDALFFDKKSQ